MTAFMEKAERLLGIWLSHRDNSQYTSDWSETDMARKAFFDLLAELEMDKARLTVQLDACHSSRELAMYERDELRKKCDGGKP